MTKVVDNIKYSGKMAKHFTGKAVCAANDVWGSVPLYLAISSAIFGGMYMNMEDMDTTGTDQQEAVYQQASAGIDSIEYILGQSNNLYDVRDGLENFRDSGMAGDFVKSDAPIDDQIKAINYDIFNANYELEQQLKSVLANIYLSGNESGLALSETVAHDLLSRIASLDINEDATPKSMDLDSMLIGTGRADHLDEEFIDLEAYSVQENATLSERYELAQKVASETRIANGNGQAAMAPGLLLSLLLPLIVTCNTYNGSTLKRWADRKPEKLKPSNH